MLFFALHGWCFLGFSVELIIPAIHFPNVSPLSSLSFLPSPPPSPHQLLLTADASDISLIFFCTLEVVLIADKKPNHY